MISVSVALVPASIPRQASDHLIVTCIPEGFSVQRRSEISSTPHLS